MRLILPQVFGFLVIAPVILATQQGERPQLEAVKDILKLAENLTAKDVHLQAKKIVVEHDSCDISTIFQRRGRGGAGIGSAAPNPASNSIDWLIRSWANNKPPTEDWLKKDKEDLLKVSRVLQAMAELAPYRKPNWPKDSKKHDGFAKVTADFKVQTRELREGIEQANADKVRATAVKLNETCNKCHNLVF